MELINWKVVRLEAPIVDSESGSGLRTAVDDPANAVGPDGFEQVVGGLHVDPEDHVAGVGVGVGNRRQVHQAVEPAHQAGGHAGVLQVHSEVSQVGVVRRRSAVQDRNLVPAF